MTKGTNPPKRPLFDHERALHAGGIVAGEGTQVRIRTSSRWGFEGDLRGLAVADQSVFLDLIGHRLLFGPVLLQGAVAEDPVVLAAPFDGGAEEAADEDSKGNRVMHQKEP